MIGQIGVILHHLSSLLGAIKVIVLCAFVSRVGSFDALIRETPLYKWGGGGTYLYLKEYVTNYLHGIKSEFFYISYIPYCTIFKPFFLAESTYFHYFLYIHLTYTTTLLIASLKWKQCP